MPNFIAHIFEPVLRLLFPRPGRHRAADERAKFLHQKARTLAPPRVLAHAFVLLRGEDGALIRPYALTSEERQKRRLQRAPWLAVHGAEVAQ
ncbi:hypothetical protein [Streptomyces sp. NEAU-L66]|uniref:hypothetical protein n=1 Tax=Streptomyces sp. NEAU-L66 TaxID=3390812 RepID=UPI0039C67AE8